jgi:uncharacterized damage-inducible protein DinB
MATEVWLRGPVTGIAPVLQPAAHALIQAQEDVAALAPALSRDVLWAPRGEAATAGFHLVHLAGALDRLFTYARGEALTDGQKAALRAEATPRTDLDGAALASMVAQAVERALDQLRRTDAAHALDDRRVGRAGLPSTVLGLLFHAAEHTTRHVGQFITTTRLTAVRENAGG